MSTLRLRLVLTAVLVLVLLLSAGVVLSPLVLAKASDANLNWGRLADVGQAYGGVSALLSALAFCAIAAWLLLQWQQTRIVSIAAARERHFELARMAVDDPTLTPMSVRSSFGAESRQVVYANLMVSHWLMLWELGMLVDYRLIAAAADMFVDPVMRRWWSIHQETWAASDTRAARRFVALVSTGYDQAREVERPEPQGEPARPFLDRAPGSTSSASRAVAYFAAGAATVAVISVLRRRR